MMPRGLRIEGGQPPPDPGGYRAARSRGPLVSSWRWLRPGLAIFLLVTAIVLLALAASSMIAADVERGWLVTWTSGLGGAVFLYGAVQNACNRTTLRLAEGMLRVSAGPLPPSLARFSIETARIRHVLARLRRTGSRNDSYYWCVEATIDEGREVLLAKVPDRRTPIPSPPRSPPISA